MNIPLPLPDYVRLLLDLFRKTPDTPAHPRPQDRRLAAELHHRGVPLRTIYAALLLATARRTLRPENAAPLSPIRSLHYFLPVIEEILAAPPNPTYLDYLRYKLAKKAHTLLALDDHQIP